MLGGQETRLPPDPETGRVTHTLVPVYTAMLLQVSRDYSGFDPRTLKLGEIRFFYDGLRTELKRHQKAALKAKREPKPKTPTRPRNARRRR